MRFHHFERKKPMPSHSSHFSDAHHENLHGNERVTTRMLVIKLLMKQTSGFQSEARSRSTRDVGDGVVYFALHDVCVVVVM